MHLTNGRGDIGPHHYSDHRQLHEQLMSGRWLTNTSSDIPTMCIDGRPTEHTSDDKPALDWGPRSSGAALGLWVSVNMAAQEVSALIDPDTFCASMQKHSYRMGSHRAAAAVPPLTGCGAADHLTQILQGMLDFPNQITDMLPIFAADPSLFDGVMLRRLALFTNSVHEPAVVEYSGSAMVEKVAASPDAKLLVLSGEHEESLIVLNRQPGTTVDTFALAQQYKPAPQIFVVDKWAFVPTAAALAGMFPQASTDRLITALAAFNAGTLLALGSSDLPVVDVV